MTDIQSFLRAALLDEYGSGTAAPDLSQSDILIGPRKSNPKRAAPADLSMFDQPLSREKLPAIDGDKIPDRKPIPVQMASGMPTPTPKPDMRGLLGDIGRLSPEEQIPTVEAQKAAAERQVVRSRERSEEFRNNRLPDDGINERFFPSPVVRAQRKNTIDEAQDSIDLETVKASRRVMHADDQIAGRAPLPTQTPFRNAIDTSVKTFLNTGPDILKAGGIVAGAIPGIPEQNIATRMADAAEEEIRSAFPGDDTQAETFASALASGTGSMAGFMIGGIVAKAGARAVGFSSRIAGAVGSGGIGAAVQGVSGYEDAERLGAGTLARYTSFFLNAGLGISEAVPIDRFFNRLNTASKGRFSQILADTKAQSLEEFTQEVAQSLGSDVIARAVYDEDREIGADALMNGIVGAILGGSMGAVGGALRSTSPDPDTIPLPQDIPQQQEQAAPSDLGQSAAAEAGEVAPVDPAITVEPSPANALPVDAEQGQDALPPVDPAERAVLRKFGYSDADIDGMAPDERAIEVQDAQAAGVAITPEEVAAATAPAQAEGDGSRTSPVKAQTPADLDTAAAQAEPDPSEAQKAIGNYRKGHAKAFGLDITIKNRKGSERSGKDGNGQEWRTVMPAHYGYVKRTEGANGDQVDVYLGDNLDVDRAFIVDQVDPSTGKFDEHKVVLGANTAEEAAGLYQGGFSDGSGAQRMGSVSELPIADFKAWLKSGDTAKPYGTLRPAPAQGSMDQTGQQSPGVQAEQNEAPAGEGVLPPQSVSARPPVSGFPDISDQIGVIRKAVQTVEGAGPGISDLIKAKASNKTLLDAFFQKVAGALTKLPVNGGMLRLKDGKATFISGGTLGERAETVVSGSDLAGLIRAAAGQSQAKGMKPRRYNPGKGIIGFIRGNGGLKPNSDLTAMDLGKSRPGSISKKGRDLDSMREAAAEAGYFPQYGSNDNAVANSTRDDLLDLIRSELGGETALTVEDAYDFDPSAATESQRDQEEYLRDDAEGQINDLLQEYRFTITDELRARAVELIMLGEFSNADDAIERAGIMLAREENRDARSDDVEIDPIPFWDDPSEPKWSQDDFVPGLTDDEIQQRAASKSEQNPAQELEEAGSDQPGDGSAIGGSRPQRESASADGSGPGREGSARDDQGGAGQRDPKSPQEAVASEPSLKDTLTDRENRLVIQTGVVLRTKSGRETSPAPKVDARTDRRTKATLARINTWLHEEALKEAEIADRSGPRYVFGESGGFLQTTVKAIDPKRMSQSDQDAINEILFGDPDGPTQANVVTKADKPAKAEKPAKAATAAELTADDALTAALDAEFGEAAQPEVANSEELAFEKNDRHKSIDSDRDGKTEAGVDGKQQSIIPGTEKAPDAKMAQMGADAPLKPKRDQKAADIGLFSDDMDQADLVDLSRQPKPSAAGSAKSALKNTVSGLDEATKGLSELFGGGKTIGSGPAFDPDTYAKAKPHFKAAFQHFQAAAGDLAAMASALVKHLKNSAGFDRDAIEAMRPYLIKFMKDVQSGKESIPDAPGSGTDLERDSGNTTPENGMGAASVPAPVGGNGNGARSGARPADESPQGNKRDSARVPGGDAASLGEDGDRPVQEDEADGSGASKRGDGRGSLDAGDTGLPPVGGGASDARNDADGPATVAQRLAKQKQAEGKPVKPGIQNIRETLPILLPEQQDDVFKAEQRFDKPGAYGFLLTNGTGTGKTYSALGIAKRFAALGKKNILILAPSKPILEQWEQAAKDSFSLDISTLNGINDAGSGIVSTTYANFYQNPELQKRDFNLIVADESQNIMANKSGEANDTTDAFRAIAYHPRGLYHKARMLEHKLVAEIGRIESAIENDMASADAEQRLEALRSDLHNRVQKHVERFQTKERPKAILLSATPFPYDKTLDYAEGFLFDYPSEKDGNGYNVASGRNEFFVQNFGYRMRYNKLTEPDAQVNRDLMARNFHETLRKSGALSGRQIEVDADYDRKFALVDDAIGTQIDSALEWLSTNGGKYSALRDRISKEFFDYLAQRRLLEAIKARHAIPIIQKHLDLGRKVVIFHEYNEGGGINPFTQISRDDDTEISWYGSDGKTRHTGTMGEAVSEFLAANPYVEKFEFGKYGAPLVEIPNAFGSRAAVFNGSVPVKQRNRIKSEFNRDGSGLDVVIVNSAAGEAGLSLHDTTGKHQRVLIFLGLPPRPTTAIQGEGRIYRVGQVSDAIIRYLNTGTAWERYAFAGTIAGRSGIAESLAMGDLARGLRDSFIEAYQDSDYYTPTEGEGKGGKERDRLLGSSKITPFEKAKTFYFGQQKNSKRRDQREGADYFATPEPLGLKMVEWADLGTGERVLEPSAGHGAIARWFPEDARRTLIEPSFELSSRAGVSAPGADVKNERFEDLHITNKFDAIVMNPPFGVGGSTAIKHLEKAAGHLRNGGRIVILYPDGPAAERRMQRFYESDAAKGLYKVAEISLPTSTFERAGTSVKSSVHVFEKQTQPEDYAKIQSGVRDLSGAQTITEFFDRLENVSIPKRIEASVKDPESLDGNVTVNGIEFSIDGNILKIKGRMSRGEFADMMAIARKNDGNYDRNNRSLDFPTTDNVEAFLKALAEPRPDPVEAAGDGATSDVAFDLGKTVHAKTGADLYVASFSTRVPREEYTRISAIAKNNGGYYSSFKGRNAIPGFQFKTEEARQAFLDAVSGTVTAPEGAELSVYPVISLTGNELGVNFTGPEDMPALRRAAQAWYDQNLRAIGQLKMRDGTIVRFNQRGRNKTVSGGKGDLLLRSVPAIKEIIRYGDIVHREPGQAAGVLERLVVSAPVELEGVMHQLAVSIHKREDGQYHYDFTFDIGAGGPGFGARLALGAKANDSLESAASKRRPMERAIGLEPIREGWKPSALPTELYPPTEPDSLNLFEIPATRNTNQQDNAPAGWGEVDPEPMPRLTPDQVAEVRNIVRSVAGLDTVATPERIIVPVGHSGARAWGRVGESFEASGYYDFTNDIVAVSMALPAGRRVAYHESFHRLQSLFLTEREQELLRKEGGRLRDLLRGDDVRGGQVGSMSQSEVEAEAFAVFATRSAADPAAGAKGIHIGLRRAFMRMLNTLRRVRNYLAGAGFQTYEDVFAAAKAGDIARRAPRAPAGSGQALSVLPPHRRPAGPFSLPNDARYRHERWMKNTRGILSAMPTLDLIRRRVQDRFLIMRRYQEQVQEAFKINRLPEQFDVYQAESLYYGRAGERIAELREKNIDPLIEDMRNADVSHEELSLFLYAKHARERNATIAERNPEMPDGGSGLTNSEADQILQDFRSSGKAESLERLAKQVYAINQEALQRRYNAGLLSKEQFEQLKTRWKFYVPLRGYEGMEDGVEGQPVDGPRTGQGYQVKGKEFKAALGRGSRADSPLAFSIMNAMEAITRAEKNRVGKTFLRLVQAFPNKAVWEVKKAEVRQRLNPDTGLVEQYVVPLAFTNDQEVFSVKVGGNAMHIVVKDPRLVSALKNLGASNMSTLVQILSKFTRFYASLQTAWNPEFVLSNFSRDMETALGFLGEHKIKGLRRTVVKNTFPAMKGMYRNLHGKTDDYWTKVAARYREAGGKISFFEYQNIETLKQSVEKDLNRGKIGRLGKKLMNDLVEIPNGAVENAVRLATFEALIKAGMTEAKAASAARELTVNFNRKGEWGGIINAFYVFFNASIQGNVRLLQLVAKSRSVRKAVIGTVLIGLVFDMLGAAMSDDDEDTGKSKWDLTPDWERTRNIIFPGTNGTIKIPLAYGFNIPYVFGQELSRVIRGASTPLEAMATIAGTFATTMSPIGGAPSLLQFVMPTILDPVAQISENKNWLGNKVMPDRFGKDDTRPDSQLAYDSVGTIPKWVAETLNDLTGGSKYEAGAIDVSPESIELFAEFLTGGIGRLVSRSLKTGEGLVTGTELEPNDIPFVRVFYRGDSDFVKRNLFYDSRGEIQEAHNAVNNMQKDRVAPSEIRAYRQRKAAELKAYEAFKSAEKKLRPLSSERRKIQNNKAMSFSDKKAAVDRIREKELKVMMRAQKTYLRAQEK